MPSDHSKQPFDPFTQEILIRIPGHGRLPLSMIDIDHYAAYGIRICINYSSQIGASFILLIVLLLLTRPEKRWTAIYTLNVLALLFNTIRSILQCVYFTGPFYNAYAFFSGDYSQVPDSQYGASIAGAVFTLMLVMCLEASLVLQVRAVCVTMTRLGRIVMLVLSVAVALAAIGFRFALAVLNSIYIRSLESFIKYQWLAASSNYVTAGSICFFSLVFVTKLGFALKQRQKLGLRQFGPMQIVFIMGCQTLFIPAVFSVLQAFTSVPELGSQVLTLVAIFLPLSSLWASQSVTNAPAASSQPRSSSGRNLIGSFGLGSLFSRRSGTSKGTSSNISTSRATDSTIDTGTFKSIGDNDGLEYGDRRIHTTRTVEVSREFDDKDEK